MAQLLFVVLCLTVIDILHRDDLTAIHWLALFMNGGAAIAVLVIHLVGRNMRDQDGRG